MSLTIDLSAYYELSNQQQPSLFKAADANRMATTATSIQQQLTAALRKVNKKDKKTLNSINQQLVVVGVGLAELAVLGDFSKYWISELDQIAIQRLDELYAKTSQIGFIVRVWRDGMPVLEEAFQRLVLA